MSLDLPASAGCSAAPVLKERKTELEELKELLVTKGFLTSKDVERK